MSTGRLIGLAAALLAGVTLAAFSYIRFDAGSSAPDGAVLTPGDAGNAPSSSMLSADQLIEFWRARVERDPRDYISFAELGGAFLRRARETSDVDSYTRAEAALQRSLALNPKYAGALGYEASLRHARHDFRGALEIAERIYSLDPRAAHALAVSGDANLELGQYGAAEAAYTTLLSLSDSAPVLSRLAHLRELQGKPAEAIELMTRAAAKADEEETTNESRAWYHSQLARLYLSIGELEAAEAQYDTSVESLPGYIQGLAGLARVAAARGDYEDAIGLYEQVVARQPVLEYVVGLGDVYGAAGREDDAQREYELVAVIDSLYEANGINTDLEMALFLADHGDPEEAVAQATGAYEMQPGSIRTADVLSWALYKAGRFEEALTYSDQALRLGTKDALLLFHAGMINHKLGDVTTSRERLQQAIDLNPHFSILHAKATAWVLSEKGVGAYQR